jgi:hypothetical protein
MKVGFKDSCDAAPAELETDHGARRICATARATARATACGNGIVLDHHVVRHHVGIDDGADRRWRPC